ncbi:MAG: hypothetical protein QG588_837, partial [Candidatus Poribacteria bacterium]|nr:hypothetical protein [Candidatus Poribacteria bacterium]
MQDSEIQEICKRIYKRHKKALDLIFKYKPDKQEEIRECLVNIIEKDADLILDDSYSKRCVRFIAKNFDFIPKEGSVLPSKRILTFAIYIDLAKDLRLYLDMNLGPKELREKLYKIANSNTNLFNMAKRPLFKTWFSFYKKTMLSAKEYEEKEIDEIKELLEKRLRKFKETDLLE